MIRDGGGARSTRVVVAVVFVVVGCSTRVLWCVVLSTHAIHGYIIISITVVPLPCTKLVTRWYLYRKVCAAGVVVPC